MFLLPIKLMLMFGLISCIDSLSIPSYHQFEWRHFIIKTDRKKLLDTKALNTPLVDKVVENQPGDDDSREKTG